MCTVHSVAACLTLLFAVGVAANTTYCFGSGSGGRLGDGRGNTVVRPVGDPRGPDSSYSWPLPTAVINAPQFASVYSGAAHTCALTAEGNAYCWGNDILTASEGSEGTSQLTPASVPTNLAFSTLAVGDKFTCGLSSGKAYCFGDGSSGQLGTGSNTSSAVPVEVAGGHTFASIALGHRHACATTPQGAAWCWGDGLFGQLGSDTTGSAIPVPVVGGLAFTSLAAGDKHTCGIADGTGMIYCWGSNADGQLGTNRTIAISPKPVPVADDSMFTSITAGALHTCAISTDSLAYCWGSNLRGQLGTDSGSSVPELVAGRKNIVWITAGSAHTCAIDSVAAAWCWGEGEDGQLGTGKQGRVSSTVTDLNEQYHSTIPVPVAGDLPFFSISAGGAHTCGISPKAAATASPLPVASPPEGESPAASPPVSAAEPSPMPYNVSSPAPQPAPAAEPSASSAPIGAIVGAVVGGMAVSAVLLYLALRPGKGWLRRAVPVQSETAGESPASSSSTKPTAPTSVGWLWSRTVASDSRPPVSPMQPTGTATPILPNSLPLSYISSSDSCGTARRPYSPKDDPTLQYIASYVASRTPPSSGVAATPRSSRGPASSGGSAGSTGGAGSSTGLLLSDTSMWLLQWSDLEILEPVGRGSFGAVYKARWQETAVAVKVLFSKGNADQLGLPDATMRELQAEAAVMIRMRHPNIVQFMGLSMLPPALITEYCARGSLFDVLRSASGSAVSAAQLTWARRLAMAIDAATGLVYLHSRSIVHRDVKSPNFLVDEHWRVKASDFNLSRILEGDQSAGSSATTGGGATNPIWLAPEILRGMRASAASDVFSFGVVLWELLTWQLPWAGTGLSAFQIGAKVVHGERLELPPREALPGPDTTAAEGLEAYCDLVRQCWAQAPLERPTMAQVVRRLRVLQSHGAGSMEAK